MMYHRKQKEKMQEEKNYAIENNFYYLNISLVKLITIAPKAKEEIGEYHCKPSM